MPLDDSKLIIIAAAAGPAFPEKVPDGSVFYKTSEPTGWGYYSGGAWTLGGLIGPQGPRGSVWHRGNGAPVVTPEQRVGDWYVDADTGNVYVLE